MRGWQCPWIVVHTDEIASNTAWPFASTSVVPLPLTNVRDAAPNALIWVNGSQCRDRRRSRSSNATIAEVFQEPPWGPLPARTGSHEQGRQKSPPRKERFHERVVQTVPRSGYFPCRTAPRFERRRSEHGGRKHHRGIARSGERQRGGGGRRGAHRARYRRHAVRGTH